MYKLARVLDKHDSSRRFSNTYNNTLRNVFVQYTQCLSDRTLFSCFIWCYRSIQLLLCDAVHSIVFDENKNVGMFRTHSELTNQFDGDRLMRNYIRQRIREFLYELEELFHSSPPAVEAERALHVGLRSTWP